jgi:hypothetical protein
MPYFILFSSLDFNSEEEKELVEQVTHICHSDLFILILVLYFLSYCHSSLHL